MKVEFSKYKTRYWPFFVAIFLLVTILIVFSFTPAFVSYVFETGTDNDGKEGFEYYDGKSPLWVYGSVNTSLHDGKLFISPSDYDVDANGTLVALREPWFTILFDRNIVSSTIMVRGSGNIQYFENLVVNDGILEKQNQQLIQNCTNIYVSANYPIHSITFYLVDLNGFTFDSLVIM